MKKGKWKIIKFWDTISVDIGTYKYGWNYEVGFWVNGEIYNEEYFLKEEGYDEHAQTHTSCRDDIPLDIVNKIKELGYKIVKED